MIWGLCLVMGLCFLMEIMLKESVKTGVPLQDEFRIYGDPYFASIGMKNYVRG